MAKPGHIEQSKVCDDNFTTLQEYILTFEILMNYSTSVKVAHSLGDLLGNHNSLGHVELVLLYMNVRVERPALAQAGDDGQPWGLHARPHEQHQILMACFTECAHFSLESLKSLFIIDVVHSQFLDGYMSMPIARVDNAKPSSAYDLSTVQFIIGNVPLRDTGHTVLSGAA